MPRAETRLPDIERNIMARRIKIYEGKAKILYEGPEPGTIVQYFKDDATAFNAEKMEVIDGKGVLNNRLSEFFMTGLNNIGVPTHFLKRLNMREQLVRACEIIPLEIIVRNYAAGTICTRLGLEEGAALPRPIVEYSIKMTPWGTRWCPRSILPLLAGRANRIWTTCSALRCGSMISCQA